MPSRKFFTIAAIAIMAGLLVGIMGMGQNLAQSQESMTTTTRDSVTLVLDWTVIPSKDFLHIYDSTPYKIMNGHIAAKLPCGDDGASEIKVVVGQAPDVKPVEMEIVNELSNPGKMCVYHVDLPPEGIDVVTDAALLNPTDKAIRLPRTSTVVLGVNEIMPLGEEQMEHGG